MNNNAFVNDSSDDVCSVETGVRTNGIGSVTQNGGNHSNGAFNVESTDNIVPSSIPQPQRENWGKSIEFLMSCIAMSVGLGNVWRFPFTALENGGGAFLLPYLIVLAVIGRPLYFLEMIIGQFSSRNSIDVYDLSPMFRGNNTHCATFFRPLFFFVHIAIQHLEHYSNSFVKGAGYGQLIAIFLLSTYYASIMALIGRYLFDSFKSPLPWTQCKSEWLNCIDPMGRTTNGSINGTKIMSSSEHYFM